jgi:hypothetical protein
MSKADVDALLDRILGPMPIPKPKVVVSEGQVIRDADVAVSPADRNSRYGTCDVVQVRVGDPGWLKPSAEEEQIIAQNRARATNAKLRQEADPFGWGHWGPTND